MKKIIYEIKKSKFWHTKSELWDKSHSYDKNLIMRKTQNYDLKCHNYEIKSQLRKKVKR